MEILLAAIPPAIDAVRYVAQEGTTIAITDKGIKFIGAGMAMGLGSFGPAMAIGNLVGRALDALGRNPEAQPVIQTNMILGLAFAEAIGIYALGFNLPALVAQLINFGLLLVVFSLLLYKPLLKVLDERKKRIQEGLEASDE